MKKKALVIALIVLAALVVIAAACYAWFSAKPVAGAKHVTIEVTHIDGTKKVFEHDTDAEYLRGVLEELDIVEGEDNVYGLWITGIDGYTANADNQEWWGFTKDGEYVETGAEMTPVYDGDHFEFTLNVGYDSFG